MGCGGDHVPDVDPQATFRSHGMRDGGVGDW
jgi:hypothetical protein